MLTGMIDAWALWLLLVGLVAGVAVTGVLLWRLPRREDDLPAEERRVEAAWIGAVIERHGGSAPVSFVEEVLDLHQAYLRTARPPGPPAGAEVPPVAGPGPGYPLPAGGFAPPAAPPPGYAPPSGHAPGQVPPPPPPPSD
jgi:hypothetical protein